MAMEMVMAVELVVLVLLKVVCDDAGESEAGGIGGASILWCWCKQLWSWCYW